MTLLCSLVLQNHPQKKKMSPEAKNYKQVSDTVKAEIQATRRRVFYLFMEYITNRAKEKAFVVFCFFFPSLFL